jgi:curli biogenesis system outer membrane secretion channel CsgG
MRSIRLIGILWLVSAVPAVAADAARPRVAVLDFDTAVAGRTLPPPDLGAVAAQVLIDRLVSSGSYHVYDGRWLCPEAGAGRVRLDQARAAAQRAGVDYLVLGSITRFTEEQRNRAIGAGALLRVPVLGGVRTQKAELVITVLIKFVDVHTGEIATMVGGMGRSSRSKLGVGGLGVMSGGGFSRSTSGARDAQIDEALQRSIELAAHSLPGPKLP